jgi:hypothetical protein
MSKIVIDCHVDKKSLEFRIDRLNHLINENKKLLGSVNEDSYMRELSFLLSDEKRLKKIKELYKRDLKETNDILGQELYILDCYKEDFIFFEVDGIAKEIEKVLEQDKKENVSDLRFIGFYPNREWRILKDKLELAKCLAVFPIGNLLNRDVLLQVLFTVEKIYIDLEKKGEKDE